MTFDELMKAYYAGEPGPEGGVKAVLRALLDEMSGASRLRDIEKLFSEILASDGVDRTVKDSGGAFEGLMDGLAKACSPAAAPDVCEWTTLPRGIFHGARIHAAACDGMVRATFGFTHCPTCKRAISFKSEAAR